MTCHVKDGCSTSLATELAQLADTQVNLKLVYLEMAGVMMYIVHCTASKRNWMK